jgi:hypothetical protein
MRLRRLAVLVLTLTSVTLPAGPAMLPDSTSGGVVALTGVIEPDIITPPPLEPGPGGPASCCIFG